MFKSLFEVEVLVNDVGAKEFYTKDGFVPLADNDLHLFLPIRTIEKGSSAENGAPVASRQQAKAADNRAPAQLFQRGNRFDTITTCWVLPP